MNETLSPTLPAPADSEAEQTTRYVRLFENLSPLLQSKSVAEIAEASCRLIASLLEVRACSILHHHPADGTLRLLAATHIPREEWPDVALSCDSGLCGEVYTTGRAVLLREEGDFARFGMTPRAKYGNPSCLAAPLSGPGGRVFGVVNAANPLTSRVFDVRDAALLTAAAGMIAAGIENARLREEAEAARNRLRAAFDGMHFGVASLDSAMNLVHCNRKFTELAGRTENDPPAPGPLSGALPRQLFNFCSRLLRQAAETGEPARERYDPPSENGRSRTIQCVTAAPAGEEESGGAGFLLSIEDIGQEEEIRRLREADSLKRSFLRIISHELRTPLTVLQASVPVLQSCTCAATGQIAERLAKVEKLLKPNVQRLTGVVNSILDVVDIESGRLELSLGPVDLNELLGERIKFLEDRWAPKGLTWTLDFDPALPPVLGDLQRLRQIFYEMIDNAVKFGEPGSAIRLESRPWNGGAEVVIGNRGEAIEPARREEVFQKFYQLDQSLARKSGGCGLGLFLARNIVAMHGGTVDLLEGAPDETVFRVRLPGAIAPAAV